MKVALINGSPKFKDSASGMLLEIAKEYLQDVETEEFVCNKMQLGQEEMEKILSADAILLGFPLYIDSVPSHLLRCLIQIQKYVETKPLDHEMMVCAIVNNGFFDGKQDTPGIENIAHWSKRCGFTFCQGVGVGGGGMAGNLIPIAGEHGPKKNVALAFKTMCENMKNRKTGEILAVEPNFPAFAYQYLAESGWRSGAKQNGIKVRNLGLQR